MFLQNKNTNDYYKKIKMHLPNPEALLANMSAQIIAQLKPNTALVGIHSGGVWLMQRILQSINESNTPFNTDVHAVINKGINSDLNISSNSVEFGTLDAALYRDDYNQRGLKSESRPSNIKFNVQDKHIILIDDIFYTGRTTRAAMNELFDYGRPASITLAVLINRGGAQLPIYPQIVGAEIRITLNQNLQLTQDTHGKLLLSVDEPYLDLLTP